jgi:tetratricopeptide (TPR) repeat protein
MNSKSDFYASAISSCLLADPTSSRNSIRLLLSKIGLKQNAIHVSNTAEETLELIGAKRPEVVFIDQSMVKGSLSELVQFQESCVQAGAPRITFLISGGCSSAEISGAADERVDAILAKPFTYEDLEETILRTFEEKFFPKPDQQMINKGTALLKSDNFQEALKCFEEARRKSPESVSAAYYFGHTQFKLGEMTLAKQAFEDGLKLVPTHYRCLLGMVEVFMTLKDNSAAYEYAQTLAKSHPVPIKKIPKFVHLAVLNLKFEDVLSFYNAVEQATSFDEEISIYMGAGLVVCGLFFLRKDEKEAAGKAFRKAEVMAKKNPRIFSRILLALSEEGLESEYEKFVKRVPEDVQQSVEFQSATMEANIKSNPPLALKIALELISYDKATADTFRTALELSFLIKRKRTAIVGLIDRARSRFPDDRSIWNVYEEKLMTLSG